MLPAVILVGAGSTVRDADTAPKGPAAPRPKNHQKLSYQEWNRRDGINERKGVRVGGRELRVSHISRGIGAK